MFKNKKYGYDNKAKEFITLDQAIVNELNPEPDLYAFDSDPQYTRSTAITIETLQKEVNALKTILTAIIPTLTKKQRDLISESFNLESE